MIVNELSTITKTYTIYNYDSNFKFFTYSEETVIHEGTGCPAHSTHIAPSGKIIEGFLEVFSEEQQEWIYVENHIGKEVYNIHTKEKHIVNYLGQIEENFTFDPPPSKFHSFIDNKWILSNKNDVESYNKELVQEKIENLKKERIINIDNMNKYLLLEDKTNAKKFAMLVDSIDKEIESLS